jgi:hypothetical protein
MTRVELVQKIVEIVSNYKVNSTIDVDGSTMLDLEFSKVNFIQVEGFDTENIYLFKYVQNKESKKSYILKLEKAPYKLLKKLNGFFENNLANLKKKDKKFL